MNNINPSQTTAETTPATARPSEFWTVFLLSLFLGVFGAHRFYARKFKSAIVQLVTFGGLGIWAFIDVIVILLGKFKNAKGVVFKNPKPKVAWSIFVVACVFGLFSAGSNTESSNSGSHPYHSNTGSHKSARQLIKDHAQEQYGRNVDVTIDGGYAGGAYTVTISDHDNFHTYTYAAEVDEAAQKITSWRLTASD